jgi:2-polyprenyl-3-methyl-5-hydroxy-6-metoxy-1,4-benzoquinol methylase
LKKLALISNFWGYIRKFLGNKRKGCVYTDVSGHCKKGHIKTDSNMDNSNKLNDIWTSRWNDRYSKDEFAYGEEPNNYLKEQLAKLTVGTILFPAEGEGRNAVFAAKLGWNVSAFDISNEGKSKAIKLAEKNNVTIDYKVGELETLNFESEQFDAIALIYAHFPANIKSLYHKTFDKYLKINGTIIFESFSKKHIDYVTANEKVGGPKDIESLFSIDEIKLDFPNYEVIELVEMEIELNEGLYHNGTGSVIRFIGRKTTNR